ncbi:hypothetical protein BPAE_0002g01590 [Botrytis paeoniae]|uniref:Uncharacterized protein n=1 Tax=Botrytis paeoniae TaxID=278948 RepID=A0A4Z1G2J7_9HELO|nr:hypothetical protein BPAE_0002g01590 [Botrytis paeoniae]
MAESKATEELGKTDIETLTGKCSRAQKISAQANVVRPGTMLFLQSACQFGKEITKKWQLLGESINVSFDDEESSEVIELEPYPMSQVSALEIAKPSGNNNITLGILKML